MYCPLHTHNIFTYCLYTLTGHFIVNSFDLTASHIHTQAQAQAQAHARTHARTHAHTHTHFTTAIFSVKTYIIIILLFAILINFNVVLVF